jgi:hypothetical protein
MMSSDWREDISDINSLYDIDPLQMMIFLRHQYILVAKDMLDDDWEGMGLEACQVAEALETAIEAQCNLVALTD